MSFDSLSTRSLMPKPIYLVSIEGSGTREYYSEDWDGRTTTALPGLSVLGALSSELDVQTGAVKTGNITIRLNDFNGQVTDWVTASNDIANTQVILKTGYAELAEADFQTSYYYIRDAKYVDFGVWEFKIGDFFSILSKNIVLCPEYPNPTYPKFRGESSLQLDYDRTAPSTYLYLAASTSVNFPTSGYLMLYEEKYNASHGWGKYCEIMHYTNKVYHSVLVAYVFYIDEIECGGIIPKDSDTTELTTWLSGYSGGNVLAFPVFFYLGNPIDFMLRILTTTAAGGNGSYDEADGLGLGIDEDAIDIAGIEAARDDVTTGFTGDFLYYGRLNLNVKDLIYNDILPLTKFFGLTDYDGRFTIKPISTLTTTDIGYDFKQNAEMVYELSTENLLNIMSCDYNYCEESVLWYSANDGEPNKYFMSDNIQDDDKDDLPPTTAIAKDSTSIANYGESTTKSIVSYGLRGDARSFRNAPWYWTSFPDLDGEAIWLSAYTAWFNVYSEAMYVLTGIKLPFKYYQIDTGDGIGISHPRLVDSDTRTIGLDNKEFAVISKKVDRNSKEFPIELKLELRS